MNRGGGGAEWQSIRTNTGADSQIAISLLAVGQEDSRAASATGLTLWSPWARVCTLQVKLEAHIPLSQAVPLTLKVPSWGAEMRPQA